MVVVVLALRRCQIITSNLRYTGAHWHKAVSTQVNTLLLEAEDIKDDRK